MFVFVCHHLRGGVYGTMVKTRHPFRNRRVTNGAAVWREILSQINAETGEVVTTFAVVWIEIFIFSCRVISGQVTTFAVVWIEIS